MAVYSAAHVNPLHAAASPRIGNAQVKPCFRSEAVGHLAELFLHAVTQFLEFAAEARQLLGIAAVIEIELFEFPALGADLAVKVTQGGHGLFHYLYRAFLLVSR